MGGWVDSSGRMYLVTLGADHVLVFDSDGTFLRRVGRRGEGPGELLDIRAFAVVDDGVFAVLDSGRGVILTFDWTGKLLREVRTRGWAPVGTGIWLVPMGDARAVYQAGFRGGDRADERWAEAQDEDEQMVYDTVIEVIDWKRGRVIASQRFDELYFPWIAPGLVGELLITPEASVRYRMLRVELEAAEN